MAALFILISGSGLVTATEILVQPGDSIQTAVDNATSGDEIVIQPGTYTENIVISTDNLVIRSESGNPENTILKARSSSSHALSVKADSVKVSGLKITGTKSSYAGIQLSGCSNCVVENNVISNNGYGIYLLSSKGSTVSNNEVTNNGDYGIVLGTSNDNTISDNRASDNNGRGIHLGTSDGNTISGNTVTSNGVSGLYVCPRSDNNLVFDNYFVNTVNGEIKNGTGNTYSTAKTAGTNIAGGPYTGGNFWGKPDGTGFSDTATDADGDGIADAAYSFENSIYADSLPLVSIAGKSTEETSAVLPVANFEINTTGGPAPLSILFTDLSENTEGREWDFNGDGQIDSIEQNPVYEYTTPGTYTVTLTVTNANGTDSETATITVTEAKEESSADSGTGESESADAGSGDEEDSVGSGGGSSGGKSHRSAGGSFGGSPEPAKNVEVKELSQVFITNGKEVEFDFTKNATCIVYVGFDAKKTAGKTTTIVEELKNKSTLVSGLPSGEVYKFTNIWVGNSGYATEKNIETPVIGFKVEKAWMQEKGIDSSSIALSRYSDKAWEQLPVSLSGEDDEFTYFTAETSGFSFFAITGNVNASAENVTELEGPKTRSANLQGEEGTDLTAEQVTEQGKNTVGNVFTILSEVANLLGEWIKSILAWKNG
ncbi:PGF-pre-PGF domain-containing protein [Methanosarcina sp. T3]|uniref:PGF-pre-PGF domain-containing protein n=1 Tax=Methanosarcina sp. T3 TaxID=3439062 RepID=UPI003F838B78